MGDKTEREQKLFFSLLGTETITEMYKRHIKGSPVGSNVKAERERVELRI